jgi:hypothetical protein
VVLKIALATQVALKIAPEKIAYSAPLENIAFQEDPKNIAFQDPQENIVFPATPEFVFPALQEKKPHRTSFHRKNHTTQHKGPPQKSISYEWLALPHNNMRHRTNALCAKIQEAFAKFFKAELIDE